MSHTLRTQTICVEGENVFVALHPAFTAYCASQDGRIFTRPAVRKKGEKRAGPRPRASYWAEVAQFVVQPPYTPPYRKCRVTQDGISKLVLAHRFILQCWQGITPRSVVVRHLDGNPLNNALSNLKYGTVQENVDDAFRHSGNYAEGSRNGRAKLTEVDVRSIRQRFASGERLFQIARDFPFVSANSVISAARRKTWTHVD